MGYWVYKCNNKQRYGKKSLGDWHEYFDQGYTNWGNSKERPALANLGKGDIVIAYQTDKNELVGIAQVTRSCQRDTWLYLKPVVEIGVKVRELKESDEKIAGIRAFRGGPIQTIYNITDSDARRLLKAAGVSDEVLSDLESETRTNEEKSFIEGEKRAAISTVRNAQLRIDAKEKWGVKCYCCGFDFEEFYGSFAKGSAIVHHLEPFQANSKKRKATVKDVRVVCANCHYVLHKTNPPMRIEDLKRTISKSWPRWSKAGIRRKK